MSADFTEHVPGERVMSEIGVEINPDELTGQLQDTLDPGERIAARLDSMIGVPADIDASGLQPLMAYPKFPLPMSMALLASAPEWFLPGLGEFPPDRTTLLEPNDAFIESYLVGLNHELMSELLWREYPTDRRGSPFQRFWPRPLDGTDIPGIDTWSPRSLLGDHMELGGEEFAILLVRGEVVRRFPDMVVTAVRAVVPGDFRPVPSTDPADVRAPLFVLPIDASTALYAFQVAPAELSAPPTPEVGGWFFVFQEHDYRMRFGFDLHNPELRSWNDLSWDMFGGRAGFARIGGGLTPSEDDFGLSWGPNADSTHIARIALQKPISVAMHAKLLLQPVGG
jgi:hypothetical protein